MKDINRILWYWFGDYEYRELDNNERIHSGDVFIQDNKAHPATDIGNGRYSKDHFPHYRKILT